MTVTEAVRTGAVAVAVAEPEEDVSRLWRVIGNLVELALAHGADLADVSSALVASADDQTRSDFLRTLQGALRRSSGRDPIMVSRDWIAQQFDITPQGVSHLCKAGHLESTKIRVENRQRSAIPLSSVCSYFGVSGEAREKLAAVLPRDAEGSIKPVFLCRTHRRLIAGT